MTYGACNGLCTRVDRTKAGGYGRGMKRCSKCEVYWHVAGVICPCCGVRLRHKPKNLRHTQKHKEIRSIAA